MTTPSQGLTLEEFTKAASRVANRFSVEADIKKEHPGNNRISSYKYRYLCSNDVYCVNIPESAQGNIRTAADIAKYASFILPDDEFQITIIVYTNGLIIAV